MLKRLTWINKAISIATAAIAISAIISPKVFALPVTVNSFANATVIDFSQDGIVTTYGGGDVGVLVGERVWFSGNSPSTSLANYKDYIYLGNNGGWNGRTGPYGLNGIAFSSSPFDWIEFTFETPVSEIGAFMNYGFPTNRAEPYPVLLYALDADGNILESFDILGLAPISTPGTLNRGEFRGISRATADIFTLRFSGQLGIDDLTFARNGLPMGNTVPAPGTLWLLAIGLPALGFSNQKRNKYL